MVQKRQEILRVNLFLYCLYSVLIEKNQEIKFLHIILNQKNLLRISMNIIHLITPNNVQELFEPENQKRPEDFFHGLLLILS